MVSGRTRFGRKPASQGCGALSPDPNTVRCVLEEGLWTDIRLSEGVFAVVRPLSLALKEREERGDAEKGDRATSS